jgi:hypothetical protein
VSPLPYALPFSGPCPTLYHGAGPVKALAGARDLLSECRPPAVQIHSHRPGLIAPAVRALLPGAVLVVGVGVDGIGRSVAKGTRPVRWGVDRFCDLAKAAVEIGAPAIVWNAEAGYKAPAGSAEKARLHDLVPAALAAVAAQFPDLAQWHTSQDFPTYHGSFPWADWLGPGSPVRVSLPQVYAAPADPEATAGKGALDWRITRSRESWLAAVRKGWIRPDVSTGTPGDDLDVDWEPYGQAHHVRADDTVDSMIQHRICGLWAYPTRADANGRNALRALCDLHRRDLWKAGGVQDLQRAVGVKPDGQFGPRTAAAAGIKWER